MLEITLRSGRGWQGPGTGGAFPGTGWAFPRDGVSVSPDGMPVSPDGLRVSLLLFWIAFGVGFGGGWGMRAGLRWILMGLGVASLATAQGLRKGPMPTAAEALGSLVGVSEVQRAAFEADPAQFELIRKPAPGDWLAAHPEPGQTVEEYRAILPQVKPRPTQKALAILPLGTFGEKAPDLEILRGYCAAFFAMETRVLPGVALEQVPAKRRINRNSQNRQLLTTDLLKWLPGVKPADCYALIAVTMEDLYPDEAWNFVFGQAMLQGGVGVFSFARYDPAFYGEAAESGSAELMLRRSGKVLTHEMGHMFGLRHCVFYECLLNGSNHLGETDSRPMHLCPVCLGKLQLGAGFGVLSREMGLLKFYEKQKFKPEADWMRRRVLKLAGVE